MGIGARVGRVTYRVFVVELAAAATSRVELAFIRIRIALPGSPAWPLRWNMSAEHPPAIWASFVVTIVLFFFVSQLST